MALFAAAVGLRPQAPVPGSNARAGPSVLPPRPRPAPTPTSCLAPVLCYLATFQLEELGFQVFRDVVQAQPTHKACKVSPRCPLAPHRPQTLPLLDANAPFSALGNLVSALHVRHVVAAGCELLVETKCPCQPWASGTF